MSLVSRTAAWANRLVLLAATNWAAKRAARAVFGLLTPRRDIKVSFPGYALYVRAPDRLIAALLCKYSFDSSLEVELYRDRVKPGMTVLEIGANVGVYTLLFSNLAGDKGKVLAFEPDPENFRLLSKSAAAHGAANITCLQAAVADRSGALKLFISEENRGDHRVYDSGEGRGSVDVKAVSLDETMGREGSADFIKMDIQGAEYRAVLGMERTVKNSPRLAMLCEFSPALVRKAGDSPEALLRKLLEYGFALNYLDEAAHAVRSASPEELLALCPGEKYLNLLLEKKRS